jgi:transposase
MLIPRKAAVLEHLRFLAMARLDEGFEPREVADFLDVSVRSVQRWARSLGRDGEEALGARLQTGRPLKLDRAQAARVVSWLEQNPCDLGFATQRWTAKRVAELIKRELGIAMNSRYLSDWLRRHGVTPQIPIGVAQERDDAQVSRWVRTVWPRIKKKPATAAGSSYLPTKAAF